MGISDMDDEPKVPVPVVGVPTVDVPVPVVVKVPTVEAPQIVETSGTTWGTSVPIAVKGKRGWYLKKAKFWFRYSVTILWARFIALAGLTISILEGLSGFLDSPSISDGIRTILNPKYIPYYLIAIAIITEIARRRSMPKNVKEDDEEKETN